MVEHLLDAFLRFRRRLEVPNINKSLVLDFSTIDLQQIQSLLDVVRRDLGG
jgi:hypothetical protein